MTLPSKEMKELEDELKWSKEYLRMLHPLDYQNVTFMMGSEKGIQTLSESPNEGLARLGKVLLMARKHLPDPHSL